MSAIPSKINLSLRWRIAAGYAALLILVLIVSGSIIVWRFQTILLEEARARVHATMHDIELAVAPQSNPFEIADEGSPFATLLDSNNLATWASPSSFVQVDSLSGYPLAKTANLGGQRIPPNTKLTAAHPQADRDITIGSRPFLVTDRLMRENSASAVVHVAEPLDTLNRTFVQARSAILVILGGAILAVIAFSIILASQAINPINQLSRAMREIGSDRLDRRLAWRKRGDEIGALAESFDDLLARLEAAFARERQFISDASHELKTPLTSINANAQMLLRWGDRDEAIRRESLETIVGESGSLAAMVNGMLTLAKADHGDDIPKTPVNLALIAQDAVRAAASRAAEKGLTLELGAEGESPQVLGDENLLRQLAGNLIDNAVKFTEQGGVSVRTGRDETGGWIEVSDTGPGIPADELTHVFERFYRADKSRSRDVPGTGLGLAIVRSIARVHGGSVEAATRPSGGARFRASFPLLGEPFTGLS